MTTLLPQSPLDYPRLARQRARQRDSARPEGFAIIPEPTYRRRGEARYASLLASAITPIAVLSAETGERIIAHPDQMTQSRRAHVPSPRRLRVPAPERDAGAISLGEEFARLTHGQQESKKQRNIRFHRPKRPVLTAFISVSAVILLVAGVILGPVIYRGTQAYQDIFQDPVPRDEPPFAIAVNPEGTQVIVETTATAGAPIPKWDGKERITLLLLGIDRREDEATRSDTMILVNIDPISKAASMLSIPRDLKVVIPGYGVNKINAAYAYGEADNVPGGGPGLTINTIEANFGIMVNYYAQIDFDGFVKVVDTAGGITLDVPYPIKDDEYPGPGNQYMRIFFKPGWQHMDGTRALQYARTRHDDGDGRRSARQQQVLLALREQAVTFDLLPKAAELLNEFGDAIRTDLQPTQALQLAQLGSEIDPAAIVSYSLDSAVYDEEIPGQQYFIIADWNAVGVILSEFTGTKIIPPMSLLANPNYSIEIRVEDGTFNSGLGGRFADVLIANGFENVTVVDKADLGNYPISLISTDTTNLTTAYLIARLLGLELDAIDVDDGQAAVLASTPTGDTVAAETPIASAASDSSAGSVALFPTPTGDSGAGSPENQSNTSQIVIVIGDDAPDPAYFTAEPFLDEQTP